MNLVSDIFNDCSLYLLGFFKNYKNEQISRINTIAEYNNSVGAETLHPLIRIIDFNKTKPFTFFKRQMGIYAIFIKDVKCGNIRYGCNYYDYEEGTLIFIAPGQVYGVETNGEPQQAHGKVLLFHPDLIHGTDLGRKIKGYTFFSYEVNEALHLSTRERAIIDDCFTNIGYELEHAIDSHSKTLICSYIELLLNHSKRFYERQFITRSHVNKDILTRFEKVVDEYLASDMPLESGIPSVKYCAEKTVFITKLFRRFVEKRNR